VDLIEHIVTAAHLVSLSLAPWAWSPEPGTHGWSSSIAGGMTTIVLWVGSALSWRRSRSRIALFALLGSVLASAAVVIGAWTFRDMAGPAGLALPWVAPFVWVAVTTTLGAALARRSSAPHKTIGGWSAICVVAAGATFALSEPWWRSQSLGWRRALVADPQSSIAYLMVVGPAETQRDVRLLREVSEACAARHGQERCGLLRSRAAYIEALVENDGGNYARAFDLAMEAIEHGRGWAEFGYARDATLLAAALAIHSGDLVRAEGLLAPLVAHQPDRADAHYNLGLIADRRNDFNRAREGYLAALRAQPNHAQARYNLALLTYRFGIYEEARHHAMEFIEAHPGDRRGRQLDAHVGPLSY
jgi:hypothetical protein